jgi:CubicO group peptidase (beta-lactamase class C family)
LDWDDKVTKVYPTFRLGSDKTTQSVLVKHLVCACTGLPRKDFDWIFNTPRGTPATTTFVQLAATEPTSGFGEVFQYNNLMATAAGYIGGSLVHPKMELGAAYDAAMREKIFAPLGMGETTLSMSKALASNHASPHADSIDGKPSVSQMDFNYAIAPYRPAGGAWSSAHDLIKYVGLELTQGVLPNGKRLVSAKNLLARRVHNVPIGEDPWYGMGLMDDQYWGVSVIHHGGSMAGYKTDILAIPGADVGAVILTNSDQGQSLLRPFRRRLLEILYDGKAEAAGDVASNAKVLQDAIAEERKRLVIPADPLAVKALAAQYVSPDLGRLRVQKKAGSVRFAFTDWSSAVATRKNDDGTLSFVTVSPAVDGFAFVVGNKDGKRTLTLLDNQHAYVFTESAS